METIMAFVMALTMLVLVIVVVGVTSWFWRKEVARQASEFRRREDQREHYVAELHNRLSASSWQEHIALQQNAPDSVDKTIGGLREELHSHGLGNGTEGSFIPDEAEDVGWGENPEDAFLAQMKQKGVDMEGPTVGGS